MAGTIGLVAVETSVGKLAPGVEVHGRLTPPAVFGLAIASSSERKTSIDTEMFGGIRKVEDELTEEHERDYQQYVWDKRLYEDEVKRLAAQKGMATKRQNAGVAGAGPTAPQPPSAAARPDEPVPPKQPSSQPETRRLRVCATCSPPVTGWSA